MIDYPGDTVGKKWARYRKWVGIREVLQNKFYSSKHLVTASPFGGDIACLRGLGVEWRNIIAVDLDPAAARECHLRWPHAEVRHANIIHVARRYSNELGSISYDSMRKLGPAFMSECEQLLRSCGHQSVLSVVFKRGHERDSETKKWIEAARVAAQCLGADPRTHQTSSLAIQIARLAVADRSGVFQIACTTYQSRRQNSNGSPMTDVSFWVERFGRGTSRAAYEAWHDRRSLRVLAATKDHPMLNYVNCHHRDAASLVKLGRALEETGHEEPWLLLNVSRGTYVAWKAHATRGTLKAA